MNNQEFCDCDISLRLWTVLGMSSTLFSVVEINIGMLNTSIIAHFLFYPPEFLPQHKMKEQLSQDNDFSPNIVSRVS